MKFLYKQTGIRVESDEMLDSTMFRPVEEEPVEEEPEVKEEPEKKQVKKTATTGKKTPAAKK